MAASHLCSLRPQLEQFIEKDLLDTVTAELSSGALAQESTLADQLEEAKKKLLEISDDALDAEGTLTPRGAAELAYYRGRLNLMSGNPAKAASCYTDALAQGTAVLPLMYRLEAFVRTGELEKAKTDLDALRRLHPPNLSHRSRWLLHGWRG